MIHGESGGITSLTSKRGREVMLNVAVIKDLFKRQKNIDKISERRH